MRGRRQNPLHGRAKREQSCPSCGAQPGESCRKEKGGIAWPPHTARILMAESVDRVNGTTNGPTDEKSDQ